MAHKIFTKAENNWKRVKKGWIKENNDWKQIKKGWVKTPQGWKLFFAGGFPKGIILPYYSSVRDVPEGWTEFTAPYGKLILGADSTYPSGQHGGTYSVTHTGVVATAGSHGGTPYPWNAHWISDGDCRYCVRYDGDNHHGYVTGGHRHSSFTGTVRTEPINTELRLIKSVLDSEDLPIRAGVLSHISITGQPNMPASLTQLSAQSGFSDYYFSAGSTPGQVDGERTWLSPSFNTSYAGNHHHGGVKRTLRTGNTAEYAVFAGNHRHTGYIKAETDNYTYRYLSVWYSASDIIEATPYMIGMWEGSVAPEGWAICDGKSYTIGGQTVTTPDLRNRFVRFANDNNRDIAGGSMKVGLGTFTDTNGAHDHRPRNSSGNIIKNSAGGGQLDIKHYYAVGHFHSNTNTWKSLTPVYYALSFIMKLPEE